MDRVPGFEPGGWRFESFSVRLLKVSVVFNYSVLEKKPEANIYTTKDFDCLDFLNIPYHVAIIMDGNRRWAAKHNLDIFCGHKKGAEALTHIVKAASEIGIKVLTVYAFSTENWKRPKKEREELWNLFEIYLQNQCNNMVNDNVKLQIIGDLSKIPSNLIKTIANVKNATKNCKKIELVLAINYGARNEICRAVKAICEDFKNNKLTQEDLTEDLLSGYMDTSQWPDPDLLIRTSGEMRISNFLLWQISYTEIFVTHVLWPEFNSRHLLESIINFQKRQRRLGGGHG